MSQSPAFRKQVLCPDCGGGMKYGGFKVWGSTRIQSGYGCNYCGTVVERFGTLDVVRQVTLNA